MSFAKDQQWSRKMFLLPTVDFPQADNMFRDFCAADLTYHDTSIGGNAAINPLPQGTRYADPPIIGPFSKQLKTTGMGAIYSEAFNSHQQIIYIRFGVPKFNSMFSFITGFYNYGNSIAARTGRAPGLLYNLTTATASVAKAAIVGTAMVAAAASGAFFMPFAIGLFAYGDTIWQAASFLLNKPHSKYYYLKDTMASYWSAVTFILNYIAINMNIRPMPNGPYDQIGGKPSDYAGMSPAESAYLKEISDLIFDDDGFIDVRKFATKGQLLARAQETAMKNEALQNNIIAEPGVFAKMYHNVFGNTAWNAMSNKQNGATLVEYLKKWNSLSEGSYPQDGRRLSEFDMEPNGSNNSNGVPMSGAKIDQDSADFFRATLDDGSAFLALRVDYTGSAQESFSNSTTESEIRNKLNAISASSRESMFTIMGGNVGKIPVIGDAIAWSVNQVKEVIGGLGDSLGVSGIAMLGGAAFADIPKHWQDSQYSGPKLSYNVHLDCIWNHPIARLAHLFLPYACLLAGALPIATGTASYTSPYICEVYDRGRGSSRLCILRDLNATRGDGNLGFMDGGKYCSMDLSFSFEELSSVMSMPLSGLFDLDLTKTVFSEDTVFSDYMASLTGLGLTDMIYQTNKLTRNIRRLKKNLSSAYNMESAAQYLHDTTIGRALSVMYRGVDKQ